MELRIIKQGVKQIGRDAAHLYHMLLDQNLIENNERTKQLAHRYSDIMSLRFDNERSLLKDLPQYIIEPLFSILSQYSDGAYRLRASDVLVSISPAWASLGVSVNLSRSTSLALRPDMVQMDKAVNATLGFGSNFLDFDDDRSVSWYVRTSKISESGVMGDATKATAEKGREMWEVMIANMVRFVESIKNTPLEDLYQKRY